MSDVLREAWSSPEQMGVALLVHLALAFAVLRAWRSPTRAAALGLIGASAVGVLATLLSTGALYVLYLRRVVQSACVADGSSAAAFALMLHVVDEDLAALLWRGGVYALLPATIGTAVFISELRRASAGRKRARSTDQRGARGPT